MDENNFMFIVGKDNLVCLVKNNSILNILLYFYVNEEKN